MRDAREKINSKEMQKRKYDLPKVNSESQEMRSSMLHNLLVCMHMGDQFRVISDLAFDALDEDGSGQLDDTEIALIMQQVADSMGVPAPTDEDIIAILQELDDDFDG